MPWIKCCAECVRKLEANPKQVVLREGDAGIGVCQYDSWRGEQRLMFVDIMPRRVRYVRRSGGGERERAGHR